MFEDKNEKAKEMEPLQILIKRDKARLEIIEAEI